MRFRLPRQSAGPIFQRRKTVWGFTDPEVVIADREGMVVTQPMSAESAYYAGMELDAEGFDAHIFRSRENDRARISYLHSTGYAVVQVPEGFLVTHCPEGVTVEKEDYLRDLYHEFSTRKARTPAAKIGRCPFTLNPDARAAVAVASAEEGEHVTIASEYIAFRDWKESITSYDVDTMHSTILTVGELARADSEMLSEAAADVLGSSEREDDPDIEEYLGDLGLRLRRLARWMNPRTVIQALLSRSGPNHKITTGRSEVQP